jgi:hypothetical protein
MSSNATDSSVSVLAGWWLCHLSTRHHPVGLLTRSSPHALTTHEPHSLTTVSRLLTLMTKLYKSLSHTNHCSQSQASLCFWVMSPNSGHSPTPGLMSSQAVQLSTPRWLASISQLTRHFYATAYNNRGSYASARGNCLSLELSQTPCFRTRTLLN